MGVAVKKVIYLMVFGMLGVWYSCASPRTSKVNSDSRRTVERVQEDSIIYDSQTIVAGAAQHTIADMKQQLSDIEWEYNKTNYSMPDSQGLQYPVQVETGTMKSRQQVVATRSEHIEETLEGFQQQLLEIKSSLNEKDQIREIIKVEEKKLSWWEQIKIGWGGIAMLAFLLCLFRLIWIRKRGLFT